MKKVHTDQEVGIKWSEHARIKLDQPIWRSAVDHSASVLAVECRNPQTKEVSIRAINLSTGKIIRDQWGIPTGWDQNLADLEGNVIYLYEYGKTSIPKYQKLYALDIKSGKLLWEKEEAVFKYAGKEHAEISILKKNNELQKLIVDNKTGEKIKKSKISNDKNSSLVLPFRYEEDNNYYDSLSKYINDITDHDASGAIDYMQSNHLMMLGYTTQLDHGLSRFLLITTQNGELKHHEQIDTAIKGVAPAAFFRFHKYLVVFTENTEVELLIL